MIGLKNLANDGKRRPEILVDMDDVLVDWRGEALRQATDHPELRRLLDAEAWTHHDLFTSVRDVCGAHLNAELYRVIEQPHFHRDLPWIPGGKEALADMEELGYEVRIVTWPWAGHQTCASEKLESVRRHLGRAWESRVIITSEKAAVLGQVLIDDKPHAGTLDGYPPPWVHVLFEDSPVCVKKFATHPPEYRLPNWSKWREVIQPLVSR